MLCLTNITKKYKEKLALDDVSLELAPGIYGLLGPNGAGKSTTVKLINNIYKPTRGKIFVDGIDTSTKTTAQIAPHVGYVISKSK